MLSTRCIVQQLRQSNVSVTDDVDDFHTKEMKKRKVNESLIKHVNTFHPAAILLHPLGSLHVAAI